MKVEKWKYKGELIDIPIVEEDDIETNINIDTIENTRDLTEDLKKIGDINEQ